MTPEFNREIGIPRVAAIEYPYGRTVGQVDDVDGQRQVLLENPFISGKCRQPRRGVSSAFHLAGGTQTHQMASTGNLTDNTIVSG